MSYYCSKCKKTIPYTVYSYSMDKHGKALCREHQKSPSGLLRKVVNTIFSEETKPKKSYYSKPKLTKPSYSRPNPYAKRKETTSNEPTPEAKKLCYALKKRGIRAELEKWDGFKHIDIAITSAKLNIEVDGRQHHSHKQSLADLKRTYHSSAKGYETIRIPNVLVKKNVEKAADLIADLVNDRRRLHAA